MEEESGVQVDPELQIQSLKESLEECRNKCSNLEREKHDLRSGFEQKRTVFKEVYQGKEKLVNEQALELQSLRLKLNQNEEKISKMAMEVQDLKVIASVSENTKQEAVDNLRKRHQEEMDSLQKAMEASNEESQREMVRHFERERRQWENNLTSMKYDKGALEMQLDEARKRFANNVQFSEEEELEASMKKAHAEAEKLKSVILPLENEISTLKQELYETRVELEKSEKAAAELGVKALKDNPPSQESEDVAQSTQPESEMVEPDPSFKSDHASKTELQRYVEVLQQQKKKIENDRDEFQENIAHLRKKFEMEKEEHAVLKQTWLAANDQFLESQRLLMRDNNMIEGVLSEDQRRQVKLLKLKAQASEAREVPAKSPMSSLALLKMKTDKFKEVVADSLSQKSDDSDTQSFGSYQEFEDAADAHQQTVSLKLTLPDLKSRIQSEAEYFDGTKIVPGPGQKVVDIKEWNDMLHEIEDLRNHVGSSTVMPSISTPGKKHADLFEDDAKMSETIEALTTKIQAFEQEKAEDGEKTKSLEESIRYSAEDAQKQVTDLANKLSDFERLLGNLNEKQIKTKALDINQMTRLTEEKDKYRDELLTSKKERDRLAQLQSKHLQALLKEMPSPAKSSQSTPSTYQKALAAARAEKDNLETKLKNEIAFMEERLKAEQSTREQLETSLASELHDARGEIISLQPLKTVKDDLQKAFRDKEELERQNEKSKTSYEALQAKSSEIIKGLRDKHLAEIKAKEDVESALADAKIRLQSLHSALETSEHVQRDFVRLSQSLQVELEQVRQEREEKERKSDADTSSVQSLEFPPANTHLGEGGTAHISPALSPETARKSELQKTKSSS